MQVIRNQPIENTNRIPPVTFSVSDATDPIKYNSLKNKVARVAWLIFSIIIFPVGIARFIGSLINRTCVMRLMLPATSYSKVKLNEIRKKVLENPNISKYCERIVIETIDKVKLDTVMVRNPQNACQPIQEQKFILFLNGNGGCYESMLTDLVFLSQNNGVNIYSGNYRGVGESQGFPTSYQDLERDGIAMVEYLLSLGVKTENIMIHGWSLGGGVGAHVAVHYQKKGHEIGYCNDRSFSSMEDEVDGILTSLKNEAKNGSLFNKIIAYLAPVSKILLHALNWNFKTLECYNKMNGPKIVLYHRKDEVIPYEASLYKKLKDSRMTERDRVEKSRRIAMKASKQGIKNKKFSARPYHPQEAIRLEGFLQDPFFLDGVKFEQAHCAKLHEFSLSYEKYRLHLARALKV